MSRKTILMAMVLIIILTSSVSVFATENTITEEYLEGYLELTGDFTVVDDYELKDKLINEIYEELGVDEQNPKYAEGDYNTIIIRSKSPLTISLKENKDEIVYAGEGIFGVHIQWDGDKVTEDDIDINVNPYDIMLQYYGEEGPEPNEAYTGTLTVSKPGNYYTFFQNHHPDGSRHDAVIYITIEEDEESTKTENKEETESKLKATPTASTVLVNNTPTEFEAYTIDGNNYFKLRDLAQAVNNTEKNFEVEWDGAKNAINLISNTKYTEVGGELTEGDNSPKEATLSTSTIYKDGEVIELTAYTINGNNFFKLRDIAEAFSIGVTWDGATSTIGIDTSIDYVAE